jgi:hypothetical protein
MKSALNLMGKCLLVSMLVSLLLVVLFLWAMDYQQVCTLILGASGKLHRLPEFQTQYLTPGRFSTLRVALAALLVVYLGAFVFLYPRVGDAVQYVGTLLQWVKAGGRHRWSGFTTGEKAFAGAFTGLLLLLKAYEGVTFPIFYDEAWTYINMSSKNVLVSMSYYPAPNNHILFSILTNLTVLLPLDPTFALRLPNLLLLPVCYLTVLLILREFFNSKVALLGAAAFMTAYPVALYTMQARGYFLCIWLSVLSIYCAYKMLSSSQRHFVVLWVLANTLGFYAMPSFLYLFGSVSLFAALICTASKDWARFRTLIVGGVVTGGLVVILYMPVFLISGVRAITNNSYVQKRALADIYAQAPTHFANTGNWMLGGYATYGYLVCAILLLAIAVEAFRNSGQRLLALAALVLLTAPLFIVFLHRVIPFERTWSYCIFPLVLGFCFLVQRLNNYLPTKHSGWYFITVAVVLVNCIVFNRAYQRNYALDKDTRQIAQLALKKDFHSFFIANDYQEVLLYYYYLVANQPYQVTNVQTGGRLVKGESYDCLLVNKQPAAAPVDTSQFKLVLVSGYSAVFEKKPRMH